MKFRKWGKKNSYPYFWTFSALVNVSLNLLANFINAHLVKSVSGFEHILLADLALFWFTQPRLVWMATILVKIQQKEQIYPSLGTTSLLAEAILQGIGAPTMEQRRCTACGPAFSKEGN